MLWNVRVARNVHVARHGGLFTPPHKAISTLVSLHCLTAHWSKL